ncbi:hypothetical protein EV182_001394, partial [Spiromyces aspiralis]
MGNDYKVLKPDPPPAYIDPAMDPSHNQRGFDPMYYSPYPQTPYATATHPLHQQGMHRQGMPYSGGGGYHMPQAPAQYQTAPPMGLEPVTNRGQGFCQG